MVWRTLLFVLLFAAVMASPLRADATTDDVAGQLICQCGCNKVLNKCDDIGCTMRESMLATISQKLGQGESSAQIIQYFVGEYGEKVLASPPKKGFNLAVWLGPYLAILIGGAVIYMAVRKWVKRNNQPVPATGVEPEEEDEKYQRRLEAELKQFGDRGFR